MLDLQFDRRLFEGSEMSFALRMDDPKAIDMVPDYRLQWKDEVYFITETSADTDETGVELKRVKAEIGWMRLADIKRVGTFQLTDSSPEDGLIFILSETGWTVGNVDVTGAFSLELTDESVLTCIWEWARIVGGEPLFDVAAKTVSIYPMIGIDIPVRFEYGRNMQDIKRVETAPKFTRIFPKGRDDLTVSSVAGVPYIEDYSWYTAQGLTLDEAKANHRKDELYFDDSMVDAQALYDDGAKRLSFGSQGTITYQATVTDLSSIVGIDLMDLQVGDRGKVRDLRFDETLDVRVSRYIERPLEPERNQVELTFGVVLLPTTTSQRNAGGVNRQWELFVSGNPETNRQVRIGHTILNRIKLRTTADSEWVVGFSISAVGVGSSTLTLEFTDDETGLPFWETVTIALTGGQTYDYAFSFGQQQIPAGTTTLVVRAYTNSGSAGINIGAGWCNLWVLARGVTREQVTLPNSIRFDYTGAVQYWVVPDDIFEVQIEAVGSASGGVSNLKGNGGRIICKVPVTAGANMDVYVGGQPWPNAGTGGVTGSHSGSSGGGSTDIRPSGGTLATCLVCAPGGGGPGEPSASAPSPAGGNGGFYTGADGRDNTSTAFAKGATQSAGGAGGGTGDDGAFNQGGNGQGSGNPFDFGGGGAGGGYYGGEGGAVGPGGNGQVGGGGGVGIVDPSAWDLEYMDGANSGVGYLILSWEDPLDV